MLWKREWSRAAEVLCSKYAIFRLDVARHLNLDWCWPTEEVKCQGCCASQQMCPRQAPRLVSCHYLAHCATRVQSSYSLPWHSRAAQPRIRVPGQLGPRTFVNGLNSHCGTFSNGRHGRLFGKEREHCVGLSWWRWSTAWTDRVKAKYAKHLFRAWFRMETDEPLHPRLSMWTLIELPKVFSGLQLNWIGFNLIGIVPSIASAYSLSSVPMTYSRINDQLDLGVLPSWWRNTWDDLGGEFSSLKAHVLPPTRTHFYWNQSG